MSRVGIRRTLLGTVLAVVIALLTMPTASAAPTMEVEPNDNIFQVSATANTEGLMGVLGADGDLDYFWLGLRPQRQIRMTAAVAGCADPYNSLRIYVREPTDSTAYSLAYLNPDNGSSSTTTLTTPGVVGGPTQYFLVSVAEYWKDEGLNCRYSLKVTNTAGGATDAIDPTPPAMAPVVNLTEPNDLESQANGPLTGDVDFAGAIETSNDADYVYFQVKANMAANVRLSVAAGQADADSLNYNYLSDLSASAGYYDLESTKVSSSDQTFKLKITGTVGTTYRIMVSPASSLGTTPVAPPPPPPPPAKKLKITLKANKYLVSRGGFVTLKGRVNRSRGKVKIYQKLTRRGSRWVVEASKCISPTGRFRHREDVRSGSRRYIACYKGKCSKTILVRMR